MIARLGLSAAFALIAGMALARDDITIGMVLEPPNLDPTSGAAAAVDEIVYANIFEGLTRIGPDGTVQPALAERWDILDEGRSYVFHLRRDIAFHDGSPFDADDVVFTLNRARAEDSTSAQKQLFAGIETVEADGPHTVRITLSAPDGGFPFNMAWGDAVIVSEDSIDQIATHPIGTGPYRFERWRQGDRVELRAFDGYWGKPPQIREATFRFIPDPGAAFAAVMAQDVDAFPNFPARWTPVRSARRPRQAVSACSTRTSSTCLKTPRAAPRSASARPRKAAATKARWSRRRTATLSRPPKCRRCRCRPWPTTPPSPAADPRPDRCNAPPAAGRFAFQWRVSLLPSGQSFPLPGVFRCVVSLRSCWPC